MSAEPARDFRHSIQGEHEARSIASDLSEASEPSGNSEHIAQLYTELATSFGSDDSEGGRLIYRELLRLGRPRAEILAAIAQAAAPEPKQTESANLGQAIAPTEVGSVVAIAALNAQSRLMASPVPTGSQPAHTPENSEISALEQKESKRFRRLALNVRSLIRASAACFTPLCAAAATAILIILMVGAGARSSVPTREAAAPAPQRAATPFQSPTVQSTSTSASTPAEPARSLEDNDAIQPLSANELATLRARGDALLSTGDLTASRLFYERAVVAGDAEAAIRLGATYDPAFLSRAHLQNVRGDLAIALSWYRRARDLGAVEAEMLLKSIEGQ